MSAALHIRQAAASDVAAILALTREAYAKWIPRIGREPRPMTADYDAAVRAHRIDLLYLGEALVGLIEMIPRQGHLLIENVAVSPAVQGKGYGRKLLSHAEEVAGALGYREIRLYTNKLFEENVKLYMRLGYAIDREEVLAHGQSVIHMYKSIS